MKYCTNVRTSAITLNASFMLPPERSSMLCCYTKIMHTSRQIGFENSPALWYKFPITFTTTALNYNGHKSETLQGQPLQLLSYRLRYRADLPSSYTVNSIFSLFLTYCGRPGTILGSILSSTGIGIPR